MVSQHSVTYRYPAREWVLGLTRCSGTLFLLLLGTVDLRGCGGTLVAPRVVISAAHCGDFTGKYVIVGGYEDGKPTGNAQRVRVADTALHPGYSDSANDDDYSVLLLEEAVHLDTNIVVTVNDNPSSPYDGQPVTVLGLGNLSGNPDVDEYPTFLQDVEVEAIGIDTCNAKDAYDNFVDDEKMICAGKLTALISAYWSIGKKNNPVLRFAELFSRNPRCSTSAFFRFDGGRQRQLRRRQWWPSGHS